MTEPSTTNMLAGYDLLIAECPECGHDVAATTDGAVRVSVAELAAATDYERRELLAAVWVEEGPAGLADLFAELLAEHHRGEVATEELSDEGELP